LAGYWSYPAFVRSENQVYWLFLVLRAAAEPKKNRTALFRPKGAVVTLPNSMTVVRYDNFLKGHDPFPKENWDTPKGMFPHKPVADLTRDGLLKKEVALLTMCEEECRAFGVNNVLHYNFRTAWLELIHPVFLLYLRPLAREFFDALKVEK
jgi:hypothetical protein